MNKKRSFFAFSMAVIIVLFSFGGCGQASVSQGPAIWMATDPETAYSIYLFGSIHVAEESLYPFNDTIMNAFDNSDYLAVEVDVLSYSENTAKVMETAKNLLYTDGKTIVDEIDADLVSQAQEVLTQSEHTEGIPVSLMTLYKPYVWISTLTELSTEKSGLSAELGVDLYFLERARALEKEILEIESIESQMKMLTGFSPEIQAYQFEDALEIDKNAEGTRALYEAWQSGDLESWLTDGQSVEIDENLLAAAEEYERQVVTERNKLMSDTAEAYLQEGKRVFYVVGAMHMVGETGIVQQLISRGYEVVRI